MEEMDMETSNTAIQSFLGQYPPFNLMTKEELQMIAELVDVQFYAQGQRLFERGDAAFDHFFVIQRGGIRIIDYQEGQEVLIDECDEGDIFGVRASIAGDSYIASAEAEEDSYLYTIPMEAFNLLLEKNPKVALFLTAGFASGVSILKSDRESSIPNLRRFLRPPEHFTEQLLEGDTLNVNSEKRIIDCSPDHTIREAAKIMGIFGVGSILVTNAEKHPLGIITDTDFRLKVVAAEESLKHKPVTEIMSHPVQTIRAGLSVAEVMLKMIALRLTHLVVTEDGTPNSPAIGVASQRDILIAQGNNPSVLAKQMLKAKTRAELAKARGRAEALIESYLHQEVGVPFISNVITEINDVLIQQAIKFAESKLAEEGLEKPNLSYTWLSLGSEGRREQLLRTDQDNALVYQNPPKGMEVKARDYFLRLSKEINDTLIEAGFVKCPANMMASNPQWCQPLFKWKHYFTQWISQPSPKALMNTSIFFDFRPVGGDKALADELKQHIFTEIDKGDLFLAYLAKNALQNPSPLSFFRSFIVEKGGAHKNEFDIKARAMMPLADAARVLAYDFRLTMYGSTSERFEEIARLEPGLKDLCESAAMAYEILVRQRAIHGLKNHNSGRFINPDHFNKLERQTIRSTFKTIDKIQQMLELRYRLNFIR